MQTKGTKDATALTLWDRAVREWKANPYRPEHWSFMDCGGETLRAGNDAVIALAQTFDPDRKVGRLRESLLVTSPAGVSVGL